MGISNILKMFGSQPSKATDDILPATGMPKCGILGGLLVVYRKKRKKAKKVAYASKRYNRLHG